MTDLRYRLRAEPEKTQLQLLQEVANQGDIGAEVLMEFLQERQSNPVTPVYGKAYQLLSQTDLPQVKAFLQDRFPNGVVDLKSEQNIDYAPLQTLLRQSDFQAADRMTLEKLCELAGEAAIQRKWLYFTEVESFPSTDLQTINTLWLVYSEGKFGFSVQRDLWLSLGKNWDKLWLQIGWRSGNNWTRYPQEFIWNLTAPKGHLPLSNQLRGVRVIDSLFRHPVWN
jgi:hypothetical protein